MEYYDNQPIHLYPANPHYFEYRGEPVLLITSAEHYGAVVNSRFDYDQYLQSLHSFGLNYTRIYTGAYIEAEGMFLPDNILGVKSEDLCLPWMRSSVEGYIQGGCLFDLDRWDVRYFNRLKDFIKKAGEYGIIVEICFFNANYKESWAISPLNCRNNIQGIGCCSYFEAQTLKDADLVSRQDAYVRKIVEEVNQFNNVILEICDEPTIYETAENEAVLWLEHMAELIACVEGLLPMKHLIAQQIEGGVDLSGNPRIQVVTSQYVWEAMGEQMGGMQALDCKYDVGKPIELNETYYYPIWYKGDPQADSRVEAWEFIVGGGAGFNHLNGIFTVANPAGISNENTEVLHSLKNLMGFMKSIDFIRMKQDKTFIAGGVPFGAFCRGISEPGRQYALYLHHSCYSKDLSCYLTMPGSYSVSLLLDLPKGRYIADWVDPMSGEVVSSECINHREEKLELASPIHSIDIALRIKATARKEYHEVQATGSLWLAHQWNCIEEE